MVHLTQKKISKTDQIKCTLEVPEHDSKLNLHRQEFNLGAEGDRERKRQLQSAIHLANFTCIF